MSRGPGRWQRLLLHAVYHDPKIAPSGRRYINVADYGITDAELSALYRAARKITAAGWVRQDYGQLEPLPETPAVVANCQLCVSVQITQDLGLSEHLEPSGVQVPRNTAPEQDAAVSVQNADGYPRSEHLAERDCRRWIVGLDGKHYPRTVERNRDRRIVLARAAGNPLRTIAADIGCSVGTVHRVLSQWQVIA